MNIQIKSCTFNDILPIWQTHLWPGRTSPIRAQSSMLLNGGTDMDIYNNEVYFYCAVVENSVVGVNSVFRTGESEFRSRGLYVFPQFRKQSVGSRLLQEALEYAQKQNAKSVWSLPRVSALATYLRAGFVESHTALDETVEFGPNVYVIKYL